ncbi:MAG: DUF2934 domain-containing protein [Pseudomonadota bacterium]
MKSGTHSNKPTAAKRRAHAAPDPRAATPGRRATLSPDERRAMIAQAAYYRAQRRGFAPGGELQDWLEAEAEIDRSLGEPTLLEHQLAHSDT